MKTLQQVKAEQMQDPVFAKEYEAIQPEMDVIRAIVEARTSQNLQSVRASIKLILVSSKMVLEILLLIY